MKKTWKYLTTSSVITALLVSGCATPAAMKGPSGLTGQQLHNIGQPATSSSWLPKFMQPAPAQPKFSGGTNVTELAATTPAPKSGKPKKVDSLSMARLHEKRGQLDQAVKLYERELKTNSKKAFIHHRLASSLPAKVTGTNHGSTLRNPAGSSRGMRASSATWAIRCTCNISCPKPSNACWKLSRSIRRTNQRRTTWVSCSVC